ncbi:hypothetical protein NPIL_9651, partial [Nephila pilipes]
MTAKAAVAAAAAAHLARRAVAPRQRQAHARALHRLRRSAGTQQTAACAGRRAMPQARSAAIAVNPLAIRLFRGCQQSTLPRPLRTVQSCLIMELKRNGIVKNDVTTVQGKFDKELQMGWTWHILKEILFRRRWFDLNGLVGRSLGLTICDGCWRCSSSMAYVRLGQTLAVESEAFFIAS